MTDDGIRETHGMTCTKAASEKISAVVIWEGQQRVFLKGCFEERAFTAIQARYLAKQLVRLADRIDARLNPVTLTPEDAKAIGSRGGHAAAASMTAQQRTERARKGAEARWKKAGAK